VRRLLDYDARIALTDAEPRSVSVVVQQRETSDTDAVVGDHDDRTMVEVVCQVVEVSKNDRRLLRGVRQIPGTEEDH
jgi:hypothetical protein